MGTKISRTPSLVLVAFFFATSLFTQFACATPLRDVNHDKFSITARSPQLGGLVTGLGSLLGGTVSGLGGLVGGVANGLGGVVGGLGNTLGSAVQGIGNGLGSLLGPTVDDPLDGLIESEGNADKPSSPPPPKQAPPPLPPSIGRQPPPWGQSPYDGEVITITSYFPPGPTNYPNRGKMSALSVTTKKNEVYCRVYADTISPDISKVTIYSSPTKLKVTCYTESGMNGVSGRIGGDPTWLKTEKGCYISGADVTEKHNYVSELNYCPPPQHWVGTLLPQYAREDCYDCTSLDCPSRNVGKPPYVDISCLKDGESVKGNRTWIRSSNQECYFPGSVFNPYGWLGPSGGRC